MATWNKVSAKGNGGALHTDRRAQLVEQLSERLQALDIPFSVMRDRGRLRSVAMTELRQLVARSTFAVSPEAMAALVEQAIGQIGGLGFLHELLPPVRNDLSEIAINADGSVWLNPKGERDFTRLDHKPSLNEIDRAVEALLAPTGYSLTEATPTIKTRLPRSEGMSGARVTVIHPKIAVGEGYPAINIRLYEPKPVGIEQLIRWEVAPQPVLESLIEAVGQEYRLMVIGGTSTGKTTLLSALANGIPREARILKIEDPEEIFLDHPHVVTLEAWPAQPGVEVPPYTQSNGVDDALRMSPRWLIVGEVRTGDVAMTLFRAQMSDHAGLTTFHAESPWHAAHRIALIMFSDAGVRAAPAKGNFASAIDLIVQIGWLEGRRRILGIWGVEKELSGGDVKFEDLWIHPGYRRPNLNFRIDQMKAALNQRGVQ